MILEIGYAPESRSPVLLEGIPRPEVDLLYQGKRRRPVVLRKIAADHRAEDIGLQRLQHRVLKFFECVLVGLERLVEIPLETIPVGYVHIGFSGIWALGIFFQICLESLFRLVESTREEVAYPKIVVDCLKGLDRFLLFALT